MELQSCWDAERMGGGPRTAKVFGFKVCVASVFVTGVAGET